MPHFYTSIAEKSFRCLSEFNRLDTEFDQLVNEIYGLKEEEIKIVEGGKGDEYR